MHGYNNLKLCALSVFLLAATPAYAISIPWLDDPFGTEKEITPYGNRYLPDTCPDMPQPEQVLDLREVVSQALCRNPDTNASWLSLRAQAASLGSTKASQYPTNISANMSRVYSTVYGDNLKDKSRDDSSSIGISLGYTLFDFGRSRDTIESAERTLEAAGHSHDSTLQGLIASTVQAYYQLLTSQGNVDVSAISLEFAKEGLAAADVRYQLGLVPLSDKLQAQTSFSQAQLSLEQAQNQHKLNMSSLVNLMGMRPGTAFKIKDINDEDLLRFSLDRPVQEMMEAAKANRNDLAARAASLESARAALRVTKKANMPTVALSASTIYSDIDVFNTRTQRAGRFGIDVSIPIFTGFDYQYNVRSAQESLKAQEEGFKRAELDVMQDVWRSYINYQNSEKSWITTWDAVASATQLRDLALGRYKAGVGSILDVLSAQSQYASAMQQQNSARYALLTTRADLVRSLGILDLQTMQPDAPIAAVGAP